ncbi:coiled-coil domain-containing protein 159 [Heteronotia binoei]|uniref:coiled-coil domain-containing protein 159 n=1 Tax=Heteronotia binoei TaxID=13085 RepID=UPI002930E5D6|nr:coiled-coil domain-containing protein 159 [Heteronotia binoei]
MDRHRTGAPESPATGSPRAQEPSGWEPPPTCLPHLPLGKGLVLLLYNVGRFGAAVTHDWVSFAGMVPKCEQKLQKELELLKAQLCAQTKAFEALSHSVTLLERENRQQQGRIAQLEEALKFKFASCSSHGVALEGAMRKMVEDLWSAMSTEVRGMHGSISQKEGSMEKLSAEVLESKKIVWEELEGVQAELRCIRQKLKDQDVDITKNLVGIKKIQENQARCVKFLAQWKKRVSGDASETRVERGQPRNDDVSMRPRRSI